MKQNLYIILALVGVVFGRATAQADIVGTFTAGGVTTVTFKGAAGQSSIGRSDDGTQQRGILFALPAPAVNVVLAPAAPKTNDTLTATVITAPAGQPYAYTYIWTKTSGGATTTVKTTTGTASPTDTLDLSVAGNGDVGDIINVTVTAQATRTGLSSAPATQSVTVANTPPALDLDSPNHNYAATFTDYGAATLIENPNTLTVSDADNLSLASATITITDLQDGMAETLSATTSNTNITATYTQSGGTGTLTLSGADTLANYQQVLRTVHFNDIAHQPSTTARTITFVVNDGTDNSLPATTTLTIVAVNPTPTPASGGVFVNFSNVATGNIFRNFPTLVGSVNENNTTPDAILTVQVSIQRQSDGKFYNGKAWSVTPTLFPATTGNGIWVLSAGVLPGGTNGQTVSDGKYTFAALTTDNYGQSARAAVTLTLDRTAPAITITLPGAAARLQQLPIIAGKATDAKGGTGVRQVLVFIVREADGQYFDGKMFVTPLKIKGVVQAPVLMANYDPKTSAWSRRTGLPTAAQLSVGSYRLVAIAVDGAGNRAQATSSFTIVAPAPSALSAASASVANSSVTLKFSMALETESASDAAHYGVTINGKAMTVESASYNATTRTVTLGLPEGALQAGDKVIVQWNGLSDSAGRPVNGQTGSVTAR